MHLDRRRFLKIFKTVIHTYKASQNKTYIGGKFGNRQSPIDINSATVERISANSLSWSSGYNEIPTVAYIIDKHRSGVFSYSTFVRLYVQTKNDLILEGGVLELSYKFKHLHFHWGTKDDLGSDHKIDGLSFPLEMHVVHAAVKYKLDVDRLVVVAYLFQISDKTTEGMKYLLDVIEEAARNKYKKQTVQPFPLCSLVVNYPFSYYTYKGSLTMPPYSESVTWIVSNSILSITPIDLHIFRQAAKIDYELENNFRESQDYANRTVYLVQPC